MDAGDITVGMVVRVSALKFAPEMLVVRDGGMDIEYGPTAVCIWFDAAQHIQNATFLVRDLYAVNRGQEPVQPTPPQAPLDPARGPFGRVTPW